MQVDEFKDFVKRIGLPENAARAISEYVDQIATPRFDWPPAKTGRYVQRLASAVVDACEDIQFDQDQVLCRLAENLTRSARFFPAQLRDLEVLADIIDSLAEAERRRS